MPQIDSPETTNVTQETGVPIQDPKLDLSGLDLDIIMRLEGTALGGVVKEIMNPIKDQPRAAHRSYDKFKAHGTINWGR